MTAKPTDMQQITLELRRLRESVAVLTEAVLVAGFANQYSKTMQGLADLAQCAVETIRDNRRNGGAI